MTIRHIILIGLGLVCLCHSSAWAWRCTHGLISEHDSKLEVLKKCGEPDWKDYWHEEIIIGPDTDFEQRLASVNERWVYNPGPQTFMRFLTFNGSQLVSIETGHRGFIASTPAQRCQINRLRLGAHESMVVQQCGEPDLKERRYATLTRKIFPGGRQQITIPIDEWTYNLGATYFVRILTFKNNQLIKIGTGDRGFSQ